MTDVSTPTLQERTNSRSKEQGITALTQERNRRPIKNFKENNVWIITYNFNATIPLIAPKDSLYREGVTTLKPITDQQYLEFIKQAFREIETTTNIRFREVHDSTADIDIFLGDGMSMNTGGYDEVHTRRDRLGNLIGKDKHYIILNPARVEETFPHELGHTLGLSHPDHLIELAKILAEKAKIKDAQAKQTEEVKIANQEIKTLMFQQPPQTIESLPPQTPQTIEKEKSKQNTLFYTGYSSAFNKDGSVMSYIMGFIYNSFKHYGPFDIATYQNIYGKPQNKSPHKVVNTAIGLPSTIYSEQPVTIEIEKDSGIYSLILPSIHSQGVVTITDSSRLAFDTHIANVTVKPDTITDKALMGNELINQLQGGSGNDWLACMGNGDTLTGGTGKDQFVISNGAYDTIIKDWTTEDRILVPPETVQLRVGEYRQNNKVMGATLRTYDAENKLLSSANIYGTTMDTLLQYFKDIKGWEKYQNGPRQQSGSLSAAIAMLRTLDVGNSSDLTPQSGDGNISRTELASIAINSDQSQIPPDITQYIKRFRKLQRACDLNNNGDTSTWELSYVCEQAKLAGIKLNTEELSTTLLTGSLPSIRDASVIKTAGK